MEDLKGGVTAMDSKTWQQTDGVNEQLTNRERLSSNKCTKRSTGKHKKNGKSVKTHKVVVKIPSATLRREDSGNKIIKPKLEQIKEDSEDVKEKVVDENDNEITKLENRTTTSKQPEVSVPKVQKPQETVYGLFSRTNTERSLFGTQSDITIPSMVSTSSGKSRSSKESRRPKTVTGWSKKEMELFLPRKSFFSVHNNTLANAGYDIRSDAEKQRPDWRKMLRMHTMEELYPPSRKAEEEPPKPSFSSFADVEESEDEEDEHNMENVLTSLSAEGKEMGPVKRKRQTAKKALHNDKEEYKLLYDYLKYIHDNPDEYIKMSKYSAKNNDYRHPNNLVRLGRAFRRGRQGSHARNNMYLHAIFGLKPKLADSTISQKTTRSTENTEPVSSSEELEIEKLKRKAEAWMKDLSTLQLMKAKDMALKDIGEEDVNISKWWSAFRSCSYLRVPRHMTDVHASTS